MGLQHKTMNVHGVQFHPESIASEHGHQILKNFLDQAGAK
jgi:anthranilate synthase component II